jgi:uncharacterized RDD family membrane protein YckC
MPFTKSSRKRRILAFMIDHFVMTCLMISVVFLALGPNFGNESDVSSMTTTMLLVMLPGFLLYLGKDSIKGISIGRWITGIMVRDEHNPTEIPSVGRLLIRNVLLAIWPIEFLVLATSDQKQRLGDRAAKTIVVKNPDKPSRRVRILTLTCFAILGVAFAFLTAGAAMKNSDAYKTAVGQIEQNQEILMETGGVTGYGMMPSGSINIVNGQGEAHLEIKVIGKKKDLAVSAYLEKEPDGEWKLIQLKK